MGGDVDTIKERLDIAELISGYLKLEKAGASWKGRCPFHNEKTPSFFVSPLRQSFYCFGCGEKGDIFTFVEKMEGLDFLSALKLLADRAGIELKNQRGEERSDKDRVAAVLEEAATFFEKELEGNKSARDYVVSRGIKAETVKAWRIGYAPAEWRALYSHLSSIGFDKSLILKAGLIKAGDDGREPYDVFRDRIVFPLSDWNGRIIAFSGRALSKDTEPKYLNSPDTILFTKSEVLYGLDKAKNEIRKKNYAVLVEGQMDIVLSHQAGVDNTVASSGTAFTASHFERLRKLSTRIILAFDGDEAGEKAAEKAAVLGLMLGFEVKIASLPPGADPADLAKSNPDEWKNVLRKSLPAVEFFFNKVEEKEKDPRKLGKDVERKILPMIKLVGSAIEQSHFVSMIAKRTGIKEEIIWEDLKKAKASDLNQSGQHSVLTTEEAGTGEAPHRRSRQEEFTEVEALLKENPSDKDLLKHHVELASRIRLDELDAAIEALRMELARGNEGVIPEINKLTRERDEERRKIL